MVIDVISTAKEAKGQSFINRNVVVIDVLRATTTIIQSCYNQCKTIIPCLSIKKAKETAEMSTPETLLGGERKGIKIKGFNLSNSPLEYTYNQVNGKNIVFTTTNGTKALYYASQAKHIYIGAFINAASVVNKLTQEDNDIVIICAGTNGKFSIEDITCAGLIIHHLKKELSDSYLTDLAITAQTLYHSHKDNLKEWISQATHYQILEKLGREEDIDFSLTINKYNIVPEYKNGIIQIS